MPGTSAGPNSTPQLVDGFAAIRTQFGIQIPPGAHVAAFVCNATVDWGSDPFIANNLCPTLASGLARARSGRGDYVIVLPGHSESVADTTMLANLKAGTNVIGVGYGSARPTFRWTATSSQWAISVADVIFSGLRLRLEGAVVVKAIAITGADCLIDSCDIESASGASNYAAIGIEFGTGADRGTIANCRVRGKTATGASNVIKITGTAQNGIRILNTDIVAPGHATTGLIQVNNAAVDLLFRNLTLYNTVASSTCTICLDDFASDGLFVGIDSGCKNNGTATAQGITFGTSTLVECSRTFEVDEVKKNSILSPAVGT